MTEQAILPADSCVLNFFDVTTPWTVVLIPIQIGNDVIQKTVIFNLTMIQQVPTDLYLVVFLFLNEDL